MWAVPKRPEPPTPLLIRIALVGMGRPFRGEDGVVVARRRRFPYGSWRPSSSRALGATPWALHCCRRLLILSTTLGPTWLRNLAPAGNARRVASAMVRFCRSPVRSHSGAIVLELGDYRTAHLGRFSPTEGGSGTPSCRPQLGGLRLRLERVSLLSPLSATAALSRPGLDDLGELFGLSIDSLRAIAGEEARVPRPRRS